MDLLAAFFFSSTILKSLKKSDYSIAKTICSSLIGAGFLCATYIGLFKLAALHTASFSIQEEGELFGVIAMKIAGPYGGILVCMTVALSCFTTAIALTTAFTEFLQKEAFKEKISYRTVLILSLVITFFISTFEYTGISTFLSPILKLCYPGLILLTFINIWSKLKTKKAKLYD